MPFEQPELFYTGRGLYRVTNQPAYRGRHQLIIVPRGTVTDLASVPRVFWILLPPFGGDAAAAVLHDWLCQLLALQYRLGVQMAPAPVDAVDTDGLFRRVMRESGVGFCTRWAMWAGVRWGALANPARRAGWLSTAPQVLTITATELAALLSALYAVHKVFERLTP